MLSRILRQTVTEEEILSRTRRFTRLSKRLAWNLAILNMTLVVSFLFVQHNSLYSFPPDLSGFVYADVGVYLLLSLLLFVLAKFLLFAGTRLVSLKNATE